MESSRLTPSKLVTWVIYGLAAPAASLQTISLNSLFVGSPAVGALQAYGLAVLVITILAFLLVPGDRRPQFLPRLATVFALAGLLALFVMRGKIAQLTVMGATRAQLAFAPTLVVLLVQLALAILYFVCTRKEPRTGGNPGSLWWSWAPVTFFIPLLLIGGFVGSAWFGWGSTERPTELAAEPGMEKYSRFPKPADFEFAAETERAGLDFGGQFIHYHTDQFPLIGFAFSNRDWQRQMRVANDLRGIFDADAPMDGEYYFLADPGYVVAGLEAQIDKHVHAIRVQFARLDETGLDMADSYWSAWTDGSKVGLRTVRLGGSGQRVLGLTGTAGLVVNSLGLLLETSPPSETRQTRHGLR